MVFITSEIVDNNNVKYYGVLGNGIDDDTTNIQNAINACGDYSTIEFPKGTYIISNTIFMKKHMKLKGNMSVIKRTKNVHIFEFDKHSEYNQILDFIFEGNKSAVTQPMSLIFVRGNFNTFQNCIIRNSSDHGIGFDGQDSSSCKFNIVDNCIINDNDGIGISNNLGSENKYINNTVFNNVKEGISLDNNANYNIVKANRLYNNCVSGGVGSIGIDATNYCIISDNIISETNLKPGITTQNNIDKCEYNIITGNVISGVAGDTNNKGIELHAYAMSSYPSNKISTNNLVSHNIVQNGISNTSSDNSVKDNISPNLNVDVELYKLENTVIKDISKLSFPSVETTIATSRFNVESLNTKIGIPRGMNIVLLRTYYYVNTSTFRLKVESHNALESKYNLDNGEDKNNDDIMNTTTGKKLVTIKLFYNNSRSHAFDTNETLIVKINGADVDVSKLSNIEYKKQECFMSIRDWYSKVFASAGTLNVPYYNRTRWEPLHDYYPRPTMKRSSWLNLNGTWSLSLDNNSSSIPGDALFTSEINVPFCVESINSGVVQKSHEFWYKREFSLGTEYINRRCILHFGAVDYKCWVYVNNQYVGVYSEKNNKDPVIYDNSHTGGYDSFSFEITDYIHIGNNVIHVRIYDPSSDSQIKGKQLNSPYRIWYTTCSGIWQTCWIEHVSKTNYMQNIFNKPTMNTIQFDITSKFSSLTTYKVQIKNKINEVVYEGDYVSDEVIIIPSAHNWSPNNPYLYTCTITQYTNNIITDIVETYFGLRKVHVENGKLYLNNVNIYSFGALDQGYWPDGIYTAPNDDGLKYDIEFSKNIGYNTLRKHVKVEPARWYYHCDVMGMLVQQDIPSARDSIYGHQSNEMINIVKNLRNHPSIIMWVLYNEKWGYTNENASKRMDEIEKYDTVDITSTMSTTTYTGRLVNVESGKWGASSDLINRGHVFSRHSYNTDLESNVDEWLTANVHPQKAFLMDEYGGYKCDPPTFNVYGAWGYESLNTTNFINKYNTVANMLYSKFSKDSASISLQGAIYTQITDVENETNGVMYYNRTQKIDPNSIKFTMIDHQI